MKNKILKSRILLAIAWVVSFTLIMLSLLSVINLSAATYWVLWAITIVIAIHFNIYNKEWYSRYRSIACRWLIVKLSKRVMHEDQRTICIHTLMASMHLYRLDDKLIITTSNEIMRLKIVSMMEAKGDFKRRLDSLRLGESCSKLYEMSRNNSPINNN